MLIREKEKGSRIILFTCRTGRDLKEAVAFCNSRGLHFDTVNENLPELIAAYGGDTRKINADYYIDDKTMIYPTVRRFDYYPDEGEDVKQIYTDIYNHNMKMQALEDARVAE